MLYYKATAGCGVGVKLQGLRHSQKLPSALLGAPTATTYRLDLHVPSPHRQSVGVHRRRQAAAAERTA